MFLERYNETSVVIVQSLLPKTELLLIQTHFRHVYMLDNEVSAFIYEVHLGTFTQFG
jgi:1,4-alpha-glucan branching enzyme